MEGADVDIRQAETADAEKIISVHYESVHGIPPEFYSNALLMSWSPDPNVRRYDWMKELINSPSDLVLVAERHSKLRAFSIASLTDGRIQALYVDPESSGCGVGRKLLTQIEDHLVRAGFSSCKLNSSNNAVGFYQSMGYCVNGKTTQDLSDGSKMDCYEMQKTLTRSA